MRDAQDHNEGLHGLAQDQDAVFVEADIEAREEEAAAQNATTAAPAGTQAYERRQLRDIVQDSTEQWQLPTIEADIEYTEELHAIGLVPEEVKLRMAARQREYKQMLAMGCTRGAQYLPMKIPNIDHIRVKSVSAGYSHVMLLSDEGRLYGAGYNDRGQLGLG
jgi:alpha-tubulin suppressor-like RCC1 family protein